MNVFAKGVDVKADGRFDILLCLGVGVSPADDHAFQSERIGDIPVCVVFNHHFDCAIHGNRLLDPLCHN